MKRKQRIGQTAAEKKPATKKTPSNVNGLSLLRFAGPTLAISITTLLAVSFLQFYLIIQVPSDERTSRYLDTTLTSYAELVRFTASANSIALKVAAQDPKLKDALRNKNLEEISILEKELTSTYHQVLGVRILSPDLIKTDTNSQPIITNVTLDIIRRTAKGEVLSPEVIGLGTPQQYVAITQIVEDKGQLLGVILAGFEVKMINDALVKIQSVPGYLELRQIFGGTVRILGTHGDAALKIEEPLGVSNLEGTSWQLAYWPSGQEDFSTYGDTLIFWIAITFMLLLVVTLGFYGYYRLGKTVRLDTARLLQLILNAHSPHFAIPNGVFSLRIISDLAYNLSRAGVVTADSSMNFTAHKEATSDLESGVVELADDQYEVNPFSSPFIDDAAMDLEIMQDETAYEIPQEVFRDYDIRGIVGETLSAELIEAIGQAIGSEAFERGEQRIVVARDGRLSSPELIQALKSGLILSGRDVIDIGEVPTPVLYFALEHLKIGSGVMLTASHNPASYNGLKMVLAGETLCGQGIQNLYKRIVSSELLTGKGSEVSQSIVQDYMATITSDVALAQPLKIVVDCANGVAAKVAPQLFQALGCEVVGINCKVDGNFPGHSPDPSRPENMKQLIELVVSEKADLGIAFDGDGDRLGVVDSAGNIIWPDVQMMLFSMDMLSRNPGADIIFDVNSSKNLSRIIRGNGGRPLIWKVGHSNIKAKMQETGALLGGERSGHIYFKERWFGFDDGIYAGARLLEILAADFRKSAEVFKTFPETFTSPEFHLDMEEKNKLPFMEKFIQKSQFKSGNVLTIDGIRVDYPDGWGLLRASNTGPYLVARFEAESQVSLKKIQREFSQRMLQVEPELKLPF